MRWSAVARGTVSAALRQVLWWLLIPAAPRPLGSDSEDGHPSERGPGPKLLCVVAASGVPSPERPAHQGRTQAQGFSRIPTGGVRGSWGARRRPVHGGLSSRDPPVKGSPHFPARPLPGVPPWPRTLCCPQCLLFFCPICLTPVPSTAAHCVLPQPDLSPTAPSLLCPLTALVPVLVRVVYQKHIFPACSCPWQPCPHRPPCALCPALCQTLTLTRSLPGIRRCAGILLARPGPAAGRHSLFLTHRAGLPSGRTPFTHREETRAKICQREAVFALTSEGGGRQAAPPGCHGLGLLL